MKKNTLSLSFGAIIIASSLFVAVAVTKTTITKINGSNFTTVTVDGKQYVDKNQITNYIDKLNGKKQSVLPSKPTAQVKGITFSNIIIKTQYKNTIVAGEATNHDKASHTLLLTVSFYDKNKKLLGTALGSIDNISGGATKTFEAVGSGDYSKAASYKVEVTTMFN